MNERAYHDETENGEGDWQKFVLQKSDHRHGDGICGSQMTDVAAFRKIVNHDKGFKSDHQTAAEDLYVDNQTQQRLRQWQKQSEGCRKRSTCCDPLCPHDEVRQKNHPEDGKHITDSDQRGGIVHIDGKRCFAVDGQRRTDIIDESHLPERKHGKADEHPKRLIQSLFF